MLNDYVTFFVRPKKVTKETAQRGTYPLWNPSFLLALLSSRSPSSRRRRIPNCGVTSEKMV